MQDRWRTAKLTAESNDRQRRAINVKSFWFAVLVWVVNIADSR